MSKKIQARLSGQSAEEWGQLRPHYATDTELVVAALHALHGQLIGIDHTGAILGWSEVRTAARTTECVYCEEPILAGQPYRAADTIGDVGGVFAHVACEETE